MPDTDTLTDLTNRFEQLAVYAMLGGSATVLKLNKDEMLLIRDLLLAEQARIHYLESLRAGR